MDEHRFLKEVAARLSRCVRPSACSQVAPELGHVAKRLLLQAWRLRPSPFDAMLAIMGVPGG